MEERLRRVFADVFNVAPEKVNDSLSPDQVKGWDSLGHLRLVDALEADFNVRFDDGDLAVLENVGRIKHFLKLRGASG